MPSLLTILRTILPALIIVCVSVGVDAQPAPADTDERGKILEKLRPYKHEFIVKDLNLTKEQTRDFFPLYDAMDDELTKIADETRDLEKSVTADTEASDTEVEAASRALFDQKSREGAVELLYYEKFKDILTPRQLLRLKSTEKKFNQSLLRHHRRLRHGRDSRQQ